MVSNNQINDIKTKTVKIDKTTIDNFKCEICQGYIIDATILTECLHPCKTISNIFENLLRNFVIGVSNVSVCKACIVLYLNDQQIDEYRCPTCDIEINDPRNCLQYDPKYQRLIYKFLPNLLKSKSNIYSCPLGI